MRISDWSSDVCSSYLFFISPSPLSPWRACLGRAHSARQVVDGATCRLDCACEVAGLARTGLAAREGNSLPPFLADPERSAGLRMSVSDLIASGVWESGV